MFLPRACSIDASCSLIPSLLCLDLAVVVFNVVYCLCLLLSAVFACLLHSSVVVVAVGGFFAGPSYFWFTNT